jgi:hypothetical protein
LIDASFEGLGAVLSQEEEQDLVVLSYASLVVLSYASGRRNIQDRWKETPYCVID